MTTKYVTPVDFKTMELTPTQKLIMEGKICPYCKKDSEYVDSKVIYGKSYGMIYLCVACDAYCGVHKSRPTESLGRLANKALREVKKEAHSYFDVIWQEQHFPRSECYEMLSKELGIPTDYCHIGMSGIETCKKITNWSKRMLNDLRRLDLDFGVDVKRPHYEIND